MWWYFYYKRHTTTPWTCCCHWYFSCLFYLNIILLYIWLRLRFSCRIWVFVNGAKCLNMKINEKSHKKDHITNKIINKICLLKHHTTTNIYICDRVVTVSMKLLLLEMCYTLNCRQRDQFRGSVRDFWIWKLKEISLL